MLEVLVLGTLVVVGVIALGMLTWLLELAGKVIALPFGILNWVLTGLGFLVALPFVLGVVILSTGFTLATLAIGLLLLLAPAIAFAVVLFLILRGLLRRPRRATTA